MKTINKSLTIKEYAAIVMILLSSGTAYFYMFHAGLTLLSLFFIASLVAICNKAKLHYNSFSIIYGVLILTNVLLYGSNLSLIGDVLFLISTLFITSSFSFDAFRKGLLNVVLALSVKSLFLYILYIFNIVTPSLQGVGKNGLEGYYLYAFHVFGGGHYIAMHYKVCGLFWEPGIYQMVLNICLLMNLDLLDRRSLINKRKMKLSIIIITVLLIQSTTGYLVLGTIIVGYYLNKSQNSVKFKIITLISAIIFGIVIMLSPVVTDKFSMDNRSFIVRANDFIGLSYAIFERPLTGLGVGSKVFEQVSDKLGMTSSLSAGILLQTAQFGLLWIITFYYSLVKEFRKRAIKLPVYVYVIVVTFLGIGEPLAFSPLFLINVLPFNRYENG